MHSGSFVFFGIIVVGVLIVAVALGKAIGGVFGQKAGAAAQQAKDEIGRVKADAKRGDDGAVVDDFRRAISNGKGNGKDKSGK